jgi:hypothetical protein
MARFVTVQVQCDWAECPVIAEENSGEVVEKTVALDNKQAKAFLLCKEHLVHFEEIVLPLMSAGIKVEAPANGSGKRSKTPAASAAAPAVSSTVSGNGHKKETFECQVDGCGRTISKRTGMAQHVIRTHGFDSLDAYEERYPLLPDHHE